MAQSPWTYSCDLTLEQGTCGEYKKDPNARGKMWLGCPSCVHRKPANVATSQADLAYAAKHAQ